MKTRLVWVILLLAVCLPVLVGFGDFIYPRYSNFSDLTISHMPNAIFIADTIREDGFIPLWSDRLMAGYPFSADPLAGLWYLPGWIAILLPAPLGFNLCLVIHLLWGGLGMAAFLSRLGLTKPAAIFGGIAFAAMPKLFAHLALGHISIVYAFAWYPWLLLAEENRIHPQRNRKLTGLLPGVVLGIIALADVRAAAYAGFLFLLYWLWTNIIQPQLGSKEKFAGVAGLFLGQIGIGLGVAAVQILPLIQFTTLSTRAKLTPEEVLIYSLPLKKIVNLFIPEFGGYAEWIVYPGALIIFLGILVIATPGLRKRLSFWLAIFGLTIFLSFGSNLPFMNWLGSVPGASLLRVPPRLMFIAGFALIVAASHAYNELLTGYQRPKFDPIFWMVGICAFFWIFILGSMFMKIDIGANLLWGASGLTAAVILIGLGERGRFSAKGFKVLFPVLLIVDLIGVNLQSIQFRTPSAVFEEGLEVIERLQKVGEDYRVYSPSYTLPQLASARAGISSVSAINPLQLAGYADFLSAASGVDPAGYSVAIPALEDTDLHRSNVGSQIDADLLGKLNVKYVIANYPIANSDLIEIWQSGDTLIYENELAHPLAWFEGQGLKTGQSAQVIEWEPGKIVVQADGPGDLAISEVDYPGWQVNVDGKLANKLRIANILMGVSIDLGMHQIEFRYQPWLQFTAMGISVICWLVILLFGIIWARK